MIGRQLKTLLNKEKIDINKFSQIVGIKIRTLYSWTADERNPDCETLIQIVNKYYELTRKRINIDWLLSSEGSMFLSSNDLKRSQNNIAISPEITGRHYQDIQEVNGYTDTQMAQILKISDKRYRELSLGKDFPNIAEQNNTKLNFNVDMDWFLYGEAEQKSPGTIDNQLSGASLPQLTPEQYAKLIKLLDQQ